jgi:DNA-3-methyladenine glycosylase I
MSELMVGLAAAKPGPPGFRAPIPGDESDQRARCPWGASTLDYAIYHDNEWGRASNEERTLFEKLCLEGFQSGLSWLTILRKRQAFRTGFANFDAQQVAAFGPGDVDRLLADAGIIRHRGKIEAAIGNAWALVRMWDEGSSLTELIWSHEPVRGRAVHGLGDVPAQTAESAALSKALKARGFRFVGPTTVYAAMQAMGVVNDHLVGCWVRDECETSRQGLEHRRS